MGSAHCAFRLRLRGASLAPPGGSAPQVQPPPRFPLAPKETVSC